MAECDLCLRWFHPHPCEGVDPAEVQATGKFQCRKCRQAAAAKKLGTGLAGPPTVGAGVLLQPGNQGNGGGGKAPTLTAAQLQAWANGKDYVPGT